MATSTNDRLPWYTKLAYGSADFGFAFVDSTLAVLFAIFMTGIVGIAPRMAALAIFIGKSWDWINDPLVGYFADRTRTRWGRRRPYLLFGFIPFGLAFVMLWWIPPFTTQLALAGVGVSAVHVLPWAMIPDAVEVDELDTGARHEGMFYALVTLFRKIAASIAIPLALLMLDRSGFVSNAPQQTPEAINTIRFLMGPLPSIFLLAGIAFALIYPLSRDRHTEIRAKIALRRRDTTPLE
jgi:Na+/melibiose symporter-like transporter